MDNSFYEYVQRLYYFVQTQDAKIAQLEKMVLHLTETIEEIKDRPPIHVGTIEYKFDQLKVESLEGTLNIGLNPADLSGIDDFTVNHTQTSNDSINPTQVPFRKEIENELLQYLHAEVPHMITNVKKQLQLELDDSYTDLIINDIRKQLPNRIQYYYNQNEQTNRQDENASDIRNTIIQLVKQDIEKAIQSFLRNFHKEMKEGTNNEL